MARAIDYALRSKLSAVGAAGAQFLHDVGGGFMATSRLLVTFVGCVTLVGAATVLGNASLRDKAIEQGAALVASLVPAAAAGAADAAAAIVDAAEAAPVRSPASLEPQQRHVAQYLARRYRVADEAVRRLVLAAYESGREHQVDPLLILAVMAVESSMNPFAESSMGAQGLMQVMTRVHADKFEAHGGDHAALDPIANIKVGTAILQDVVRRGGSVERGLQLYVGAGNLPDDGGYAARVLGERGRIALAASGKVDGALAAGMRADAARAEMKPAPETPKPQADARPAPAGKSAERAV